MKYHASVDRVYNIWPTPIRELVADILALCLRPRMRSLFLPFISPGDLVFDVGANVGHLTRVFLDLGARVVCVEPQPRCLDVLKRKFAGRPDVVIVDKGICDREGVLPFYVSSRNHTTSTFSKKMREESRYNHRTWDKVIEVSVTTLDRLVEEFGPPGFCKLDIEGYEWRAIHGLSSTIPFLSFEFAAEFIDDTQKCVTHLESLSRARFNYSVDTRYSFSSDQWLSGKELIKELRSKRDKCWCGDIFVQLA